MVISKILLPNGQVLTSGPDQSNAIQSVTLTQSVNAGQELTPGSVCSSMLEAVIIAPKGELKLDAGAEVTLYQNDRCMGLFTLEKPTRATANTLKLVAYDRISRLDRDITDWLAGLVDWPYSLSKLAWMVCAQCGLELRTTDFPNADYQVQQFSAQGITGRLLMQWIGEAACRFCRATVDGQVEFAWYTPSPISIAASDQKEVSRDAMAFLHHAPKGVMLQCVSQITARKQTLNLHHYGKNLLDFEGFPQATTIRNVLITTKDRLTRSYARNTQYTVSCRVLSNTTKFQISWDFYYTDGTHKMVIGVRTGKVVATSAAGKTLSAIALTVNGSVDSSVKITADQFQLELGTSATAYTPCQYQKYTVSLPEAVSAASFDWSSGILTAQETVQLKPVQIPALEGFNALYSDCGDTAVGYTQLGYYQNGLQYEDYQVAPIDKVQLRQSQEDVGVIYPDREGGNTYSITANPLLSADTTLGLLPLAQSIYEQLKDVSYTPCRVSLPAQDGLMPGDVVQVTDKNGMEFHTYIMGMTRCGQKDSFYATGAQNRQSVMATNRQSFEALNGKVLNLRMEIEGLKVENRDTAGKTAALALDVEGIQAQVTQQENHNAATEQKLTRLEQNAQQLQLSVQTVTENGVDKVKTQTGYTFDADGLHISRSGSDLTNSVTETGMYVLRNDGATMLRADAAGVVATDVSVRNYLVVGQHARLEDYTDGTQKRTACFYLGG